jgi:hypothetical protein
MAPPRRFRIGYGALGSALYRFTGPSVSARRELEHTARRASEWHPPQMFQVLWSIAVPTDFHWHARRSRRSIFFQERVTTNE